MGNKGFRSVTGCASAVGIIAFAVCGCGSSGSAAVTGSSSSTPRASTSSESTAHDTPSVGQVRLTVKVGDSVSGARLEKQTQHALLGRSAHISHTVGEQATPFITGVISYDANGNAATKLTEQIAGEKVNVVYVGQVLYLGIPSEQSGWLAIRPGGTDALSKHFAPLLATMRQSQSGQTVGLPGVVWKVTSVTPSAVTYRTHLTAAMVRSQSAKLGLGTLAKVPPTGEDLTQVVSPTGLPQHTEVVSGGATALRIRYSDWGPAIKITAPANAVRA